MSMIGLFTTATQSAGATMVTDDAAAAEGFGSALQGALAALAGAGEESKPQLPSDEPLTDPSEAVDGGPVSASVPLAPPVETFTVNPLAASAASVSGLAPSLGSETSAGIPLPASTLRQVQGTASSASAATSAVVAPSLVELVETPTGNPLPASTLRQAQGTASSASGTSVSASATPLVEPGATPPVPGDAPASVGRAVGSETSPGNPLPASTSSASVAEARVSATSAPSPAPLGATPPVPGDAPASVGRAVGSETPTGSPLPAPASSATAVAAAASAAPLASLIEPRTNSLTSSTLRQAQGTASSATAAVSAATSAAEATPAQAPVAAPATVAVGPTASVTPSAAPSPTASAPFVAQLAKPIFSLAAAGAGEHVMTVSVTPDSLGPVTVRAHVGVEGVRVELFAPNDLGRDAIRAVLTDLRRDLAGAGLGGNLTLSSQNQPSGHSGAGQPGSGQPAFEGGAAERETARDADGRAQSGSTPDTDPEPRQTSLFGATSTIDVLA